MRIGPLRRRGRPSCTSRASGRNTAPTITRRSSSTPTGSGSRSRQPAMRASRFDAGPVCRHDSHGTAVPSCEMAETPAPRRSTARPSCSCVSSNRRSRRPWAKLAERAGLPKSTTSRLVSALERQGLVQRLGDRGRLTAGPVLLRYANRDVSSTLVELAQPSLRRLADSSGRRSTSPCQASTASSIWRRRTPPTSSASRTGWGARSRSSTPRTARSFSPSDAPAEGAPAGARARVRDLDRRARSRPDRARRARLRAAR